METLTVPQMHMPTYQTPAASPNGTYMTEIKHEQTMIQMDTTRNCPSVASSSNCNIFPLSPSSSCSRESYAPMTPQQLQQLPESHYTHEEVMQSMGHLKVTDNAFIPNYDGNTQGQVYQSLQPMTATSFNGGSITPMNFNNANNNMINNNNVFIQNLNGTSPTAYTTPYYDMPYEQPVQQQFAVEVEPQEAQESISDFIDNLRNAPDLEISSSILTELGVLPN